VIFLQLNVSRTTSTFQTNASQQISAQNEKSDFSRGTQDILTDRVYQLPRKAFKLPFLERQNKNNQNPTKLRMLCVTKDA